MSETTLQAAGGKFDIGAVVGSSFRVLFRNLLGFLIASVILSVPAGIVLLLAGAAENPDTGVALSFAAAIVGMLTYLLIIAALTYGTYQDLSGHKAGVGEIVGHALRSLPLAIGVVLLLWILLLAGFMALFVPGIILMCIFYVALPVVVVERPGVTNSLRRSAELTKGNRWKVFALVIITYVVSMLLEFLVGFVIGFGGAIAGEAGSVNILAAVATIVAQVFSITWGAVLVAMAYFELRRVKEGIGLEQIAAVFD